MTVLPSIASLLDCMSLIGDINSNSAQKLQRMQTLDMGISGAAEHHFGAYNTVVKLRLPISYLRACVDHQREKPKARIGELVLTRI